VSGLGGWGDPNNDFIVPDGAFSNFHISYPSPHTIRRNFSLFPFDVPFPIFTKPGKMGNISILASTIEEVLDTPPGDFKGFQVAFEAPEVRKMDDSYVARVSDVDVTPGLTQWPTRSYGRVSWFILPRALAILILHGL
jgi:hypothetical protein